MTRSQILKTAHASAKAEMANKRYGKPLYASYREAFAEFLSAIYASLKAGDRSTGFLVVEPAAWMGFSHK